MLFVEGGRMKKHLLIICICIVILLIPISSAIDINTDVDDEAIKNFYTEPLNDYKEIITFIDGTCNDVTSKGIYIKRDVIFQAGETTWLEISGYYRPWNHFNEINVIYIHAPLFIGVIFPHPGGTTYSIWGIALGDIEWHK